jgi:DUF1365 family protein
MQEGFLFGHTHHHRWNPVKHQFTYPLFYTIWDITHKNPKWSNWLQNILNPIRSTKYMSTTEKGSLISSKVYQYIKTRNPEENFTHYPLQTFLITMPSLLGIGFNPVNFYYCYNRKKNSDSPQTLRYIVIEINNTFGAKHLYILKYRGVSTSKEKQASLQQNWVIQKDFHVSPFNKVDGEYTFEAKNTEDTLYLNFILQKDERPFFNASLKGHIIPFEKQGLFHYLKALFLYPLNGWGATWLIGYQAALLFFQKKMVPYPKPEPLSKWTIEQKKPVLLQRILTHPILRKWFLTSN